MLNREILNNYDQIKQLHDCAKIIKSRSYLDDTMASMTYGCQTQIPWWFPNYHIF